MSEVKSDKLSPRTDSGTTTLGDSGDTFLVNTGAKLDINGTELILDADADTSITADTDDQIDIRIAGADDFRFTANNFNVLSGSTLTVDSGATITNSGTATGFVGTKLEASSDTSAGDNAAIGYTAAEGLILTGQGSTDDITIKNDADTTVVNVATGATDVEVSAGNLLFGTASKGVYLGVTTATAANLLDDYEEGTYVPTLVCSISGSYNLTSGYNTLSYTKVGNLVTVVGVILIESESSPNGQLRMSLPFTTATISGAYNAYYNRGALLANHSDADTNANIIAYMQYAFTYTPLYQATHGTGAIGGLDHGDVDTAFAIHIMISYPA